MTQLSVNINKFATLRNARGNNLPDILKVAGDCERFGAQGITVHPRPDERHIRYKDVIDLSGLVKTEFNIEGYPSKKFVELVLLVKPKQVTLVPDAPDAITSNAGWNVTEHLSLLSDLVEAFHEEGIRTSIFIDAKESVVEAVAKTGTDRIELYTEPYAAQYESGREAAIDPFVKAAIIAKKAGLGVNAGHDLSLNNLVYLIDAIPWIEEVSIGHALINDALYMGLETTINAYLECLKK